jgi:hypothetical protein
MGITRRAGQRRQGSRCRATASTSREGPMTAGGPPLAALWPIHELTPLPTASRWRFAVVAVAPTGRISLPVAARDVLEVTHVGRTVHATGRRAGLILRLDGIGRPLAVDGRGRLTLPVWLRHATHGAGTALLAAAIDAPLVLVASTSLLDAVADAMVGER